MKLEIENEFKDKQFDKDLYKKVKLLPFLPNDQYDQLLSENIVFLDLYDSVANNTIIECIVRNTPVLVNPLPSVIEYLGIDYPLYFNTLEEAALKAENIDLIIEAHHFLVEHRVKRKLTGKYFRKSW